MSKVASNLLANEQVVIESHKHWISPVRDSLGAAGLILLAAVITALLPTGGGVLDFLWSLLGLVRWGLLIAGVLWIVWNIIAWRTAEFAVTNRRVLRYEGLVQKRTSETLLSSVTDVKLMVGFLGSRLGYGDVQVFTQSGDAGADKFSSITDAPGFRTAMMNIKIEDQVASRAAMSPVAAPAPTPVNAPAPGPSVEDHAASLVRLADLRDKGVITPEEFEAKKSEILARM